MAAAERKGASAKPRGWSIKILVCAKQVADPESRFTPDAAGLWHAEANLAFRMNEYDEFAVEEAVLQKEQLGEGSEVTVLSIGPDRVGEMIKKALAMGCDRAVHVRDAASPGKDPWQIASIIAAFARDKGFDLILTGLQSQDRASAQVGAMVAELLGISCVTAVVSLSVDSASLVAKRELEGGARSVVKLRTPALLTCQLGLNVPRYPTLPNIMKAKKKEILVLPVSELSTEPPLAGAKRFFAPAKKGRGLVLEGDLPALVDKVVGLLREKTTVLRKG
jgi:electron transfer flavoprotein beta subunit